MCSRVLILVVGGSDTSFRDVSSSHTGHLQYISPKIALIIAILILRTGESA